jgi:hypothetical protein
MKRHLFAGLIVCVLFGGLNSAWGMRELSDEELEHVTAGTTVSSEVLDGVLHFQFNRDNGHNRSIDGQGTVTVREEPLPAGTAGLLVLRDNAQGNLQAFVNVNAVNSLVQVLINLNVNINSSVGVLRQLNLSRDM